MGQLGNYEGPAKVFYQGKLLAETQSARLRVTGNNNKVVTMVKQFAGKSDGATESEISLENAIPRKGFERNFLQVVIDKELVRIVLDIGGERVQVHCYAEDSEYTSSTDASAGISVTLMGGPPDI